jgi:16S rRNA (cytosine967-C5)-methyltransferase
VPLHLYLKEYFGQNKKHGSKDRKVISALCYSFFRVGFIASELSMEERMLIGLFLCQDSHSDFLRFFKPEWTNAISAPAEEKLAFLNLDQNNIFPFRDELSNGVDSKKFNISFLKQPKLFIRIRPGHEKGVIDKLKKARVPYEMLSGACIGLPNASKIDSIIELDKEAVIQDYNSQRVEEFIKIVLMDEQSAVRHQPSAINVWDCCAASGGKSIMAYDINSEIHLTVSDKRESIIKNLRRRFNRAGIKSYTSFVFDLSTSTKKEIIQKFDLVIADVPCTGSGTWSRTPEQLYHFDQQQIKKYSDLQKQIIENVVSYLKTGGYLLYITCSVFKKENEDVISFIKDKFKMDVIKMEQLKGYEIEADTMFAALLKAG